ncbi:hypothetical protein GPJ56_002431 [Histomonas meleagridis]|uniref:uncharacterized protein n=1 Tax=Histomonas meleagridis TaxID=135588 RepID=UPI00355A14E1|nr:hypothetical protein GPJ56_002431 [Histomonas meleagridis]KAH0801838.1 hypothetical protein GO595_005256 [Histomonas meleagridis]
MNEIESQLSPLLEVNASNQIKMKKPDAFKFPLPPIPPHAQSHINQTASTEINTDSKSDCDWGFGSIMLSSTFYLSTCRHYATINGNRLGTNTPDIVSPDEFDRGLYLLIQLLQVIGKVVSSPIPEFNLTTEIHYINNKGISDVFTSQKLKVNKTISSFKEATKLLFKACHRLFWDLCKMNANFSVPNDIDLKTSKISGESYIYDRKSPHTFTYAMKKLVMNLKTIQTKAMECAVYVISRNFEIMSKTKEEENEKDTNEEHQLRHIESQFSITSASALFSQPTDNLSALALSENSILAPSSYEASTAETLSIISTDIMENENKSDDENIIIESIHNDEMSESDSTDHINENNIIERSKEINESDETDKSKVTNENEEENDEKDGEEN